MRQNLRLLLTIGTFFFCIPSFCSTPGKDPQPQPTIVGGVPIMAVDPASNTGSIWLRLHNANTEPIKLSLGLGNFVSSTTKRILNTQPMFFKGSDATGTPFLEYDFPPGGSLSVKVTVTNLWEAGECKAKLNINGREYILRTVKYNVPFRVTLVVNTPNQPTLRFQRGKAGLLLLKNEDPMTYSAAWRLTVPGEGEIAPETTCILPPNATVGIPVNPPDGWFTSRVGGLFKDEESDANLILRYKPHTDIDDASLPERTTPVRLQLAYYSGSTRALLGNFIIFIVLLLGGVLSLVSSLWVPNKLKQLELTRKLDDLAKKTRSISMRIDSSLRVGLRVERLRITETLSSLSMLNTDLPESFKGFEKTVDTLGHRIDVAKELDGAFQKLEALRAQTSAAPPTLLDRAANQLGKATEALKKSEPQETELQQARTDIHDAVLQLSNITQENKEFAKYLANHLKKLRGEFDETKGDGTRGDVGRRPKCKEILTHLPELRKFIAKEKYGKEEDIAPENYHWVDMNVQKLYVLRHYIFRFDDSSNDKDRHEKFKDKEEDLLTYLKLQSWNTLHLARQLRKEIEENIFAKDIKEALEKGKFAFEYEPLTVPPNQPVQLRIMLQDRHLNWSAARSEFVCVWDFGKEIGKEEGWKISHYFRKQAEAKFHVRFQNSKGVGIKVIEDGKNSPVKQPVEIPLQLGATRNRFGQRAKIELWRLSVAMAVAGLGLMAGAREQLAKLDVVTGLVAVFLIGFGADTVKNLITKRST